MVRRSLKLLALFALCSPVLRGQGGLPPVPVPPGNPITQQKALLGKALFWDEQLSSTRTVACATCHIPGIGGSDPRSLLPGSIHPGFDNLFGTPDDIRGSLGVVSNTVDGQYHGADPFWFHPQVTGRKAPSMINAAFPRLLMWDGRADNTFVDPVSGSVVLPDDAALESQALLPILDSAEMGSEDRDWDDVIDRITSSPPLALADQWPDDLQLGIGNNSYPELFNDAFGSPEVTPARIAMAMATYERTLISEDAPIDRFLNGDNGALTPQQRRGFDIFNGPGRCDLCHDAPFFTNNEFVNIGVRPPGEDLGRGDITGNNQDRGRFKVPSLRNVSLRAPYFHNGSQTTLRGVVDFYARGGDFSENQDPRIIRLRLSNGQRNDLVAFLQALTETQVEQETGVFTRPRLFAESNRVPESYGDAHPGSGGFEPRWVAEEPTWLGNPNVTLALADGLGGASTVLGFDLESAQSDIFAGDVPIHLGLSASNQFFSLGSLQGSGPGAGSLSLSFPLPNDPALEGLVIYLQSFFLDPGASSGLSATNGLRLPFFASTR